MPWKSRNPFQHTYADGRKAWRAVSIDPEGKRVYWGIFKLQGPCREQGRIDCCAAHCAEYNFKRVTSAPNERIYTFGEYALSWTERHPRAERTNKARESRIRGVLDIPIEDIKLGDWPFHELRRKQVNDLVGKLYKRGHARGGVVTIIRTLSAMTEDAIEDEIVITNAFRGVKLRANDPRIQKVSRPIRIFTFEQTLHFVNCAGEPARALERDPLAPVARKLKGIRKLVLNLLADAGQPLTLREIHERTDLNPYTIKTVIGRLSNQDLVARHGSDGPSFSFVITESGARVLTVDPDVGGRRSGGAQYDNTAMALVRCFRDTGLRIGEVLALERSSLDRESMMFRIEQTSHNGRIMAGTKRDRMRGLDVPEGRVTPCSKGLLELIDAMVPRIDTKLLFPAPGGGPWRERNFYRDLWHPSQRASGLDIRPHEMRHSWSSQLSAFGVNHADLAETGGHDLQTMLRGYTHPLNQSFDLIRSIVDERSQ